MDFSTTFIVTVVLFAIFSSLLLSGALARTVFHFRAPGTAALPATATPAPRAFWLYLAASACHLSSLCIVVSPVGAWIVLILGSGNIAALPLVAFIFLSWQFSAFAAVVVIPTWVAASCAALSATRLRLLSVFGAALPRDALQQPYWARCVPTFARPMGTEPRTAYAALLFGAACTIPLLALCLYVLLMLGAESSLVVRTIVSVTAAALAVGLLGVACATAAAAAEQGGREAGPAEGDTVAIIAQAEAANAEEWGER